MMRKLLVLVVVLAMTSVAPAAIIDIVIVSLNGEPIAPTDQITITPSEWVNLDIIYTQETEAPLFSLDTMVNIAGPGTLDLTELTWAYEEGMNYNDGTGHLGTASFTGMADGLLIDHILVHCDDLGEVAVWLTPLTSLGGTAYYPGGEPYDGTWGPGVLITQVPEPMTIALLGLGGLFLLRRRK